MTACHRQLSSTNSKPWTSPPVPSRKAKPTSTMASSHTNLKPTSTTTLLPTQNLNPINTTFKPTPPPWLMEETTKMTSSLSDKKYKPFHSNLEIPKGKLSLYSDSATSTKKDKTPPETSDTSQSMSKLMETMAPMKNSTTNLAAINPLSKNMQLTTTINPNLPTMNKLMSDSEKTYKPNTRETRPRKRNILKQPETVQTLQGTTTTTVLEVLRSSWTRRNTKWNTILRYWLTSKN